ncbi:MAG: DUF2062 domain-containing protein [Planctomycetota bacterium]
MNDDAEASANFRPAVVLPSYQSGKHLPGVLGAAAGWGLPLIVVDDGSTDDTPEVLDAWAAVHPEAELHRVTHPTNRGKGEALRSGFAEATRLGRTHALTMDTDGQHDPADAAALLAAAAAAPGTLVLGHRTTDDPNYPAGSRLGRSLSNLAILMACGLRAGDSQCGYRVVPLGLIEAVRCRAGRYGYEAELLVRAGWAGVELTQVSVRTIYPPRGQHVSHFRPLRDTLHGLTLHLRLLNRAMLPLPHPRWPPPESGRGAAASRREPWWERVLRWVDPRELVRAARRDRVGQMSVAVGLGLGVFVANLPLYPVQTLIALYVARRLHLHPVSTVVGSQAAFPPFGLMLIFAAVYLGRLTLTGAPPAWSDFAGLGSLGFAELRRLLHGYFLAWWIGGVVIGAAMGLIAFGVALLLLRFVPVDDELTTPATSP